jgi:O-antigen ligase
MDRSRWFIWLVGFLILIGSAVLAGTVIGHEDWLLLGFATIMILALCWPIEIALGLYAFLLPFNSITTLGSGTTANYALGAIAGMALLVTGVVRKRLTWPPRAARWWLVFLLWCVLTTAWALQPEVSVHKLPTAIALVLLYLVGVSWRIADNEFSLLTVLIIAGGCAAACYVVYEFASGISFVGQYGATGRATMIGGGQETNPNTLGTDLLLPFSLAVAWFVSARRWLSAGLGLGAVGIITYAVFLTMSRSALLAIALILTIFLVRLRLNRRLLGLLALCSVIAVAMPGSFFSRVRSALSDAGSGRLDIWSAGVETLKRYGLIGAGLGNFPTAYSNYAGYAPTFQGFDRAAHNTYLEAGVEFGILGVFLTGAALISHLRAVRQPRIMADRFSLHILALECVCWATLLLGLFESLTWAKSSWLTWMLCLMAAGLKQGLEKKNALSG